jgi:hypothetical protein
MTKPFSEQLSDLSVSVKNAEDAIAAAQNQAAGMAQEREDEIRAAAAQRRETVDQQVADAKDSVNTAWNGITTHVQSDMDSLRTKIDVKRYEHDRGKAYERAEDAEESAVRAIDFALDSIDYAEVAVLDALTARQSADAM